MGTFFDFSFWQQFISNLGATFIGAAVGIPVALYVNRLVETSSETERKEKILLLLRDELIENLNLINEWLSSPNPKEGVISVGYDIKTEVWDAFSDGGEIQWVKDPELLGKLANAFFRLKNMRETGSWNDMVMYYVKDISQTTKDKTWEHFMKKPTECIEAVSLAITSINGILQLK